MPVAFVAFSTLLLAPARAAPQEPDASNARHFPASDHLELMLRYMVEDGEAPAIALAVVEADGSTRAVAYGEGGRAGRPVNPGSVFEIGEITMTFTATLFADMVARVVRRYLAPVAKYLPEGVTVPSLSGYAMTLEPRPVIGQVLQRHRVAAQRRHR
ncbi:MAG: serine hydrolase, partial [Longimicrobiales bacterium]